MLIVTTERIVKDGKRFRRKAREISHTGGHALSGLVEWRLSGYLNQ
jgi:hypothetical protein